MTYLIMTLFQYAAETIIKEGGVDGSHVTVMGGSHGGFLTTHLIGQYPVLVYLNDGLYLMPFP